MAGDGLSFTFTRTGDLTGPLTINFSTSGGGAGFANGATPLDFTPTQGILTFASGSSTVVLDISVFDDTVQEPIEGVNAFAVGGTGYQVGESGSVATGAILDNDARPTPLPTVTVAATDPTATEGVAGDRLSFTFTRTGELSEPLTINFSSSGGGAGYANGATPLDFTPTQGVLIFASGSATVVLDVSATDDTLQEPVEGVNVFAVGGTGYQVGENGSYATGAILDNDAGPTPLPNFNNAPLAVPDTASAVEDGGPVTIAAAILLANDTDIDAGDTKRVVGVTASGVGVVSLNAAGDVIYDPGASFQSLTAGDSAIDTFTYAIEDRQGAQASALVSVTVAGRDEPAPPPPAGPTEGDDDLVFGGGASFIDAGGGNDTIRAGNGANHVDGGDGTDIIFGQGGDDELHGNDGDDHMEGEEGNDRLGGGGGDDHLFGGTGEDTLYGDAGNDELSGEGGHDTLEGGTGDDRLFGNDGEDVLRGNAGNDRLEGGDGKDRLEGGAGDDRLNGGASDDVLVGGAGSDTFVFEREFRADRIEDFAGEDVLQFSAARFNSFDGLRTSGAMRQSGADTVIDDGGGNILTLQNVQTTSLVADDFRFV